MRELRTDECKILITLHKALPTQKNLYYLASQLDRGYQTLYHKVKILECLGLVKSVKTPTKKIVYEVSKESFDLAVQTLNEKSVEDMGG